MKVIIIETKKSEKQIDVDMPYYYKHDLMCDRGDSIIYGRVDEKIHTSIQESSFDRTSYEVTIESHISIKNSGLSCYFTPEYQSSQEEYNNAKERLTKFIQSC